MPPAFLGPPVPVANPYGPSPNDFRFLGPPVPVPPVYTEPYVIPNQQIQRVPPWLPQPTEVNPQNRWGPPRPFQPAAVYQSAPFQGNLGQPLSQYPVQPRPIPTGEPVEMLGGMQRPPRGYLPDYIRQLQGRGGGQSMWEATY